MSIEETKGAWLGIDFSGDHHMWGVNRRSNIYVAEMRVHKGKRFLSALHTVQELPGQEQPFQKLVSRLEAKGFTAAAIDAPFSVPSEYLPCGGHKALLELVAGIERPKNWPFPAAHDFSCRILSGRELLSKKPLRRTELGWSKRKVNVRSTLWAGPRGGAAMTAACLTLLHQAKCPIWPWDGADQTGLLVEAFPAAQLCHWRMKHQGYNDDSQESLTRRKTMVALLSALMEIRAKFREKMEQSADALDAVVCAFAGVAVSRGRLAEPPVPSDEGQIAVHERIDG